MQVVEIPKKKSKSKSPNHSYINEMKKKKPEIQKIGPSATAATATTPKK